MAASAVEPIRSIGASYSSQNLDHLQAAELSQITTAEKAWKGSTPKSMVSPLVEALNTSNKFDLLCNPKSQQLDVSVDKKKSYLVPMSSQSGINSFDANFDTKSFQKNSNMDTKPQSFSESQYGGNYDSFGYSRTPLPENKSENKWDFSSDSFSSFSKERPSSSNLFDTSKSKTDLFGSIDVKSREYQPQSHNFDFELMKKTYNFDSTNNKLNSDQNQKETGRINLSSKQYTNFENSEVALKLRSTLRSEFLSNELRNDKPANPEVATAESTGALRTIEQILKQYGIEDNSPGKSTTPLEDAGSMVTSQVALSSYSWGTENASGLGTAGSSTTGVTPLPTQDKDAISLFPTSASVNTLFRTDLASNLDSKNSTASNSSFIVNCSQNNETTATGLGNSENEPLRKAGSSVDYSTGRMGLYASSSSYRSFDYGKAPSYTGESSRSSINSFTGLESRQFEGNIDRIKFEGSQVDIGKSGGFNINKSSPYDIIKNMGSLTDALEYSMSSERQRLRKLDTLISATPFNYSSLEVSRALKPQYLSPERSYSSLRSNPLTSRGMYSTSHIPSSSGHAADIGHKANMMRGTGRDIHSSLNKSVSAPGPGERALTTSPRHESSVDPVHAYSPYNSRDYNFQYNNAYSPQLLDKLAAQKNNKTPQKKPVPPKKCCLKNKKEESLYSNNNQSLYSQNSSGIDFLKSFRGDKNSPAERKTYPGKPDPKKSVCTKKSTGIDANHSKNMGNFYDGFDFVKDLNRMWKDTVFGTGTSVKPNLNQKQPKYKPYKPATSASTEKKDNSKDCRRTREIGGKDQTLVKRSDSSWAVSSPMGKYSGYESDLGLGPVQRIRSQSSLEPFRNAQPKSKAPTCSIVKQKSGCSVGLPSKQAAAAPKSILKQSSGKANCSGMASEMDRPHSAMVLSSQSYTQPLYKPSYHLIRGFSPVGFRKSSRATISTPNRNPESAAKNKPVSRPQKAGHRK